MALLCPPCEGSQAVVLPWNLWVWPYVLGLQPCCLYQSIFRHLNLDMLCAERMRTHLLHRVTVVAWWPRRMCWPQPWNEWQRKEMPFPGFPSRMCFSISTLQAQRGGSWRRAYVTDSARVSAVIHLFRGGMVWVSDGACATV